MSNDNVVPISPEVPNIADFKRLQGRPYTGPADAVRDVLKEHGFDDNVRGQGWVEIRIVAQFSDVGAIFHTVQARRVEMTQAERPAFLILKMVAAMDRKPEDFYLNRATIEEMTILDEELSKATVDEIAAIAAPFEDTESLLEKLGAKRTPDILLAITEREEGQS